MNWRRCEARHAYWHPDSESQRQNEGKYVAAGTISILLLVLLLEFCEANNQSVRLNHHTHCITPLSICRRNP